MRPPSWASLGILSCVLCTTGLAGPSNDLTSTDPLQAIERRADELQSAPSIIIGQPVARTANGDIDEDEDEEEEEEEEEGDDDEPKKSRTATARPSNTRKPSAPSKTSPPPKTTEEATSKQQSTKTASPTPSRSESTKKPSSTTDSSTSLTSTSTSTSASTLTTSSTSSSTSATSIPQPTSILQPQPQSSNRVSTGGIIAGVVLGAAIASGIAWIAIGKWRDRQRHREQFADDETKHGFTGATGNHHDWSSQEFLLAGAKPGRGSRGLRLQALSPMSRGHSFVSSFHRRPGPHIPPDVLATPSPIQDKSLPELPAGQSQFSLPHPTIAEMPSPDPSDTMVAANSQAGRSVPRKPVPQVNVGSAGTRSGPSLHPHSPPAELPG